MYRQLKIEDNTMDIQYFKQNANMLYSQELSEQLGYRSYDKFTTIFNQFIQSYSINSWLEHGYFDLIHNAQSFLIAIAQFSGFSQKEIDAQLNEYDILQKEKLKFKDSFIFVNTNFTRQNEPIWLLAMCETMRRIKLQNNQQLLFQNHTELFRIISDIVVEHYQHNQGMLGVWGKIQDYHLYLSDEIFIFNAVGQIIKK